MFSCGTCTCRYFRRIIVFGKFEVLILNYTVHLPGPTLIHLLYFEVFIDGICNVFWFCDSCSSLLRRYVGLVLHILDIGHEVAPNSLVYLLDSSTTKLVEENMYSLNHVGYFVSPNLIVFHLPCCELRD